MRMHHRFSNYTTNTFSTLDFNVVNEVEPFLWFDTLLKNIKINIWKNKFQYFY